MTTGTYPLATIVANVQRTAGLVAVEGMTQSEINVSTMQSVQASQVTASFTGQGSRLAEAGDATGIQACENFMQTNSFRAPAR